MQIKERKIDRQTDGKKEKAKTVDQQKPSKQMNVICM
jgi:hypothetical protein